MNSKTNHWHFIILVGDTVLENGAYTGATQLDLQMPTPDVNAVIERVKQIMPGKAQLHINQILEHHDHRDTLSEALVKAIETSRV